MAECKHGLERGQCAMCKKTKWEVVENPVSYPTTKSRFDSTCKNCGQEIIEGDPIYLIEETWVCKLCMEEA